MLCISLPVHQHPEVLDNQLENMYRYLPISCVVVHVSLEALMLKRQFELVAKKFPSVYVNPQSLPTEWGWMFQSHLSNYCFAQNRGLGFEYFMLEASNSAYVRPLDPATLRQHLFHAELSKLLPGTWSWEQSVRADLPLHLMIRHFSGSDDLFLGFCEGSAYERNLLAEMWSIMTKYYAFDFREARFVREEVYFVNLAKRLCERHGNGFTRNAWDKPSFEDKVAAIEVMRSGAPLWYPADLALPEESRPARNYFAIKPVPRVLDDPLRVHISNLDAGRTTAACA